jgi:hypothetical protein
VRDGKTPALVGLLERANLNHWTMDKVQKPRNSEYYALSFGELRIEGFPIPSHKLYCRSNVVSSEKYFGYMTIRNVRTDIQIIRKIFTRRLIPDCLYSKIVFFPHFLNNVCHASSSEGIPSILEVPGSI